MTLNPITNQPVAKIYKPAEIDALLAKHGVEKKDNDVVMS
jgi:20S proteasome subunit alpha 3